MPSSAFASHHSRVRFTAVAAVVCGHVALFMMLSETDPAGRDTGDDDRMTLVFFDLPYRHPEPEAALRPAPATSRTMGRSPARPSREAAPSAAISAAGIDWHAAGSRAAAHEAAAPPVRDFGFPKRAPEPREKQEFGWDKTHTERVTAMPEGGLLIRLSDNCAITLTPLPLGGCALGKRKARGDLFDEMRAPVEPGDWKDR